MKLIQKLLELIPYFDIKKTIDGQDVVYLRRYYLFRSKFFSVYLHNIRRSDDDPDPHDHPWGFVSLILKGGYVDEWWVFFPATEEIDPAVPFYQESKHGLISKNRHYSPVEMTCYGLRVQMPPQDVCPGMIVMRSAGHVHRVLLKDGKPAWTLVFAGPERRPWGFVKEGQWVFWRKYLGVWGSYHA